MSLRECRNCGHPIYFEQGGPPPKKSNAEFLADLLFNRMVREIKDMAIDLLVKHLPQIATREFGPHDLLCVDIEINFYAGDPDIGTPERIERLGVKHLVSGQRIRSLRLPKEEQTT